MLSSSKRLAYVGVVLLLSLGLCRAALFRFQEKEQAIRQACREQLKALGLTYGVAKIKYSTPEIHMVTASCLPPGGTGEVVIKGKFVPETKFVFQNDNLEVVKESLAAGEYRATVKVAPGIGPQSASVMAITPVTGLTVRQADAVAVGGKYEWTMDSANGWKIVARSTGAKACPEKSYSGHPYEMEFTRNGETKPFEKRRATLHFSLYERTNFRFSIDQQDAQSQAEAEDLQTLMKRMMDPKLPSAEREQIMKRMQSFQAQMQARVTKMTDPSYIKAQEAKRLEFSCERIELEVKGGFFTGQMRCSDKVGTRINLTGTMKPVGL
jgi:hypothetical protein